jgi:YVTN family beta-propeller protein
MTVRSLPTLGKFRNRIVFGLFRAFTLSLLFAAFGFTQLHAQTVAYVVNSQNNSVSVIDTATNTVTAGIPVGLFPGAVVLSPDGAHAYVFNANIGNGTISVIDTSTNTVTTTISLGTGVITAIPAITSDGKNLYVPDQNSGNVLVVSTATNSVSTTIPAVCSFPGGVAITPDGARAYVLCFGSVRVIDTATNTVLGSPISVQNFEAAGIAVTPDGADVYAVGGFAPTVSVISTATNTVGTTVQLPGGSGQIAITPDGSRAYIPDLVSAVDVIDISTNTLEPTTIPVGSGPSFLAITPDGAFVYVGNSNAGTVSVIATATNTVVATIPIGAQTGGIAIANLSSPLAAFIVSSLSISPNLSLNGNLTLGANTGGLDFAHQALTLTIGNFTVTLPPGTVKQVGGNMHFMFNGFINGQKVDFDLKAAHGSATQFSFSLSVKGATVNTNNPATVTLKVGHNSGTATVPF